MKIQTWLHCGGWTWMSVIIVVFFSPYEALRTCFCEAFVLFSALVWSFFPRLVKGDEWQQESDVVESLLDAYKYFVTLEFVCGCAGFGLNDLWVCVMFGSCASAVALRASTYREYVSYRNVRSTESLGNPPKIFLEGLLCTIHTNHIRLFYQLKKAFWFSGRFCLAFADIWHMVLIHVCFHSQLSLWSLRKGASEHPFLRWVLLWQFFSWNICPTSCNFCLSLLESIAIIEFTTTSTSA